MYSTQSEAFASKDKDRTTSLSIIIPTYNESQNILNLITAIKDNLPRSISSEIIVVDDNSPDGTGRLVENYLREYNMRNYSRIYWHEQGKKEGSLDLQFREEKCSVRVIHRKGKYGLISALLNGIESSTGQNILIMDADFSHPPETIPKLIHELFEDPNCIVIASRYARGGSIVGWPYKRRVLSTSAIKIAQHSLKVRNVTDPISGFFAFPRHVIENIKINSVGYKILLEILVKVKGIKVKEIPYTFTERKFGESKLDLNVILDYTKAIWYLYRYGRKSKEILQNTEGKRPSVLFLSKAGRFYSVGACGLLLNYLISLMLSNGIISNFWYMQATLIGIIFSISSNFFLNKIWTFEDRNFSIKNTLRQFAFFTLISSLGAAFQLILLYIFVESGIQYILSLIIAVAIASVSNFLLNKKWTFKEKIWG